MRTKERIIELFLFEKPHLLSYEYRKSSFKEDKKILMGLIKEGLIKQIHKDNKTIIYQYIGK